MQQRSEKKEKFPGLWDLSLASHVMAHEDSTTTLVREFNEEIGFVLSRKITVRDCRFCTSFKNIHSYYDKKLGCEVEEKSFYDMFVLFIEDSDISKFKFNDGEVQAVKWMSLFEIKQLQKENKLHPRTEWIGELDGYLNRF